MRAMFSAASRYLALVLAFCLAAVPAQADGTARIDREMSEALAQEKVAGAMWSTIEGANISVGNAGFRNANAGERMRPDDKVLVGSVTKTFVALGILRLVSEGRIGLDTPVESILPNIKFRNRWAASDPVRVRHLLDHTAGLEDARIWHVFSSRNTPDMPLNAVFEDDPSTLRLRTRPGEVFSYSNMGYSLAGMIIEKVTGERYEKWLERELLLPLDMADSSFFFVSQAGQGADPRLAWGHLGDGSLAQALPMAVRPAGQFVTTASDMAKLARFMMSDGIVAGREIVRADLLRQMGRVTGTAAARAGLDSGFALGLENRDREGRINYCHRGDTFGYHAILCIYPSENKAFFLALNNDGDGVNLQRFHKIMIEGLNPRKVPPTASAPAMPELRSWEGYYVPLVTRFAIERYTDLLEGGVELARNGDHLVFTRSGKPPLELYPLDDHRLREVDRVGASHVLFEQNGARILSDGQRSYRKASKWLNHAMWLNLWAGLAGIAYILLALPVLAATRHRGIGEPAFWGVLSVVPAGFLMYNLHLSQWGDMSLASVALAIASVLIPVGALLQIVRAWKRKFRMWKWDVAASLCVIQWMAVLGYFGLVPLRVWA